MLSSDIFTSVRLIVIFVSVTFHNRFALQRLLVISTQQVIVAGLDVIRLRDDIGNAVHFCSIDNRSVDQEIVTFYGSSHHACSLQVISNYHVSIDVPGTYPEDGFLLVKNLNDCPQRYIAIQGEPRSCNITVTAANFQLNLQSNVSVSMSEVKEAESVRQCGKSNPVTESNDREMYISDCKSIHEYNKVIECVSEQGLAGSCRFYLPSSCNVSLSKHEAISQCLDSGFPKTERVLLMYRVHIAQLYLLDNGILSVDISTFSDLKYLKELYLDHNKLEELQPGVFNGLLNLELLSLRANQLSSLDSTVFKGLVKLEKLVLSENKLSTLPETLIQDLVNLKNVGLSQNVLVTLDNTFFHDLKGLNVIDLYKNHLDYVPAGLFNGLENLELLAISENHQLETLPRSLFQDFKNLKVIHLHNNRLRQLPVEIFRGLEKMETLVLQNNPLQNIAHGTFQGLRTLKILRLRNCSLTELPRGIFRDLWNLTAIALANNELNSLDDDVFKGLHNLQRLILQSNSFEIFPVKIFYDLRKLTLLRLNSNKLSNLDADIFRNLVKLSFLDISHNNFMNIQIPSNILSQLTIFVISHNPLNEVNKKSLSGLTSETNLIVSQNEICECYAPQDVKCSAEDERSPYLTCDRLLSDRFLVVVMWLIGILSLAGNLFVIVWKQRDSHGNKVQSILLSNLAVSDLLMGVYMIIIASADVYFGNFFPLKSEKWRSGVTCRIAGTLSILSSEASVFFVTLISIDRYLHISFPLSTKNLNRKSIVITSILTWLFALALALIPNTLAGRNFKFYDNSHVCIGFPLALLETFTKQPIDLIEWEGVRFLFFSSYSIPSGVAVGLYYSTALFLGLNCICYLVILGCYIEIIRAVRASSKRTGRAQDMNMQIKMTVKVTAIVATDFLCWFPIIILGILVQTRAITLPPSVFAWLVTCVLPINSAVNPYLYTISEIISKHHKKSSEIAMQQKIICKDSTLNNKTCC